MSHITNESVFVNDIDALLKAVGENDQLEYVADARDYRYYRGQRAECQHGKIRVVGGSDQAYEIGVCEHPEGTTQEIDGRTVDVSGRKYLAWDPYKYENSELSDAVGGSLNQLHQRYSYHALMNVAKEKRMHVIETVNDKGETQLAFHPAGIGGNVETKGGSGWGSSSW